MICVSCCFFTEEEVTYITYQSAVSPDCLPTPLFLCQLLYSGKRQSYNYSCFHFDRLHVSALPTCEYCYNPHRTSQGTLKTLMQHDILINLLAEKEQQPVLSRPARLRC